LNARKVSWGHKPAGAAMNQEKLRLFTYSATPSFVERMVLLVVMGEVGEERGPSGTQLTTCTLIEKPAKLLVASLAKETATAFVLVASRVTEVPLRMVGKKLMLAALVASDQGVTVT
jgi:hypothetical protein